MLPNCLDQVDEQKLAELTLDLVKVPSPTGNCEEVAGLYEQKLREIGLEVEVHEHVPGNPSVIGRLTGDSDGPTLQLDGHLDVIPVEHSEPCIRDGTVYGRGASDMKCGLASMAEVARILSESGAKLPGTLLLTAHGMHEAPLGSGESLDALLRNGIKGDACINAEGPHDCVPVIGKGLCIWTIVITREGEVIHENSAAPDTPHPIGAMARVLSVIEEGNRALSDSPLPHLGPESYFVGKAVSGDFYNRLPNRCEIVGTRRYAPEKTRDDVMGEFESLKAEIERESGVQVEIDLQPVRDGFRLDEAEPIVNTLRAGYRDATAMELPLGGFKSVGDVSQFVRAGVPAVYHGVDGAAHASLEYVPVAEIVRSTRVHLAAALRYFGAADTRLHPVPHSGRPLPMA